MAIYKEIVVFYDISDNKKRKKVFDKLKDLGLSPIQESVFWGYVLGSDYKAVLRLIKTTEDGDKIAVVKSNLGQNYHENSKGLDQIIMEQHPDKHQIY